MPRLTGEWFQTGMVRLAGFPDNSFPDELVESGIRNPDGSIKSIFFMPLTGSDGHDVESVTFLNIGSRNADQGPFPVQARPDGACFAQWPYYGPNQVAHYDYECRLTAAGHPPLLCEIAFYADRLSGLPPDWRPYSGRIVYYASFIPKPPPACTPGSMPFACTRSK